MRGHHNGGHGGTPPGIHLPPPSLSPALIGLGIFILSYGLLYALPLLIIGGAIFLFGLITWLIDDARAFMAADHGVHGGGSGHGTGPGH
ncbi:MAG: hypothetical protein FJ034_01475 [Chloroflexi bacterium]|nr:hypothetical protein [Chloroflexota bacterium]